jgi:hypothetical protein
MSVDILVPVFSSEVEEQCTIRCLTFHKFAGIPQLDGVDIVTGYRLDDRGIGVPSPGKAKNFLFYKSYGPALGPTQPPIQWVPGALSPGVKRLGREADH